MTLTPHRCGRETREHRVAVVDLLSHPLAGTMTRMFPQSIHSSGLFGRIREDGELLNALDGLRSIAAGLAETVARSVPGFTDHSVQHMDALWAVTDRVLTPSEVGMLTPGEAFLLAAGFYLHDIGMAYAATDEGVRRCRASTYYEDFVARIPESRRTQGVDAQAIAVAVRRLHAAAAIELATSVVPGTSVYLFESLAFREAWGETAGRVAASHHWGLEQIDRDLGAGGAVPLPGGRKGDLAYVACVLRVVDYAHINRERAPTIDRAFRGAINQESLVHWLAQENVDGPERENDELIYRAARPIADVEAWWLYFEMLSGLDAEIRAVRRYLDRRPNCRSRLSLQGVRGAASPQEAATYIEPGDFLPIEVNLRTGSIDRLVQLLAGESLYGPDPMAAVRELLQNARDAVELKATIDLSEADRATLALPIRITLSSDDRGSYLEVVDWGVGMTQKVMTDYLIAIASDYWTSQFYTDFPKATERGFQPAGKFGIGFLSVFMLGDEITVESNRSGGERSALTLRGVGRRGELRRLGPAPGSGTRVHVRLKDSVSRISANSPELVRVYAPMLNHTLVVEAGGSRAEIRPRWLFNLSADEFRTWTLDAVQALSGRGGDRYVRGTSLIPYYSRGRGEEIWGTAWPDYQEQSARLVASLSGSSLLCLKGLVSRPA